MQDHHDQYTNNVAFKKVMQCTITQRAVTFFAICVLVEFKCSYFPETPRGKDNAKSHLMKENITQNPFTMSVRGCGITLGYEVKLYGQVCLASYYFTTGGHNQTQG